VWSGEYFPIVENVDGWEGYHRWCVGGVVVVVVGEHDFGVVVVIWFVEGWILPRGDFVIAIGVFVRIGGVSFGFVLEGKCCSNTEITARDVVMQ